VHWRHGVIYTWSPIRPGTEQPLVKVEMTSAPVNAKGGVIFEQQLTDRLVTELIGDDKPKA
jgi:hypothetical protein